MSTEHMQEYAETSPVHPSSLIPGYPELDAEIMSYMDNLTRGQFASVSKCYVPEDPVKPASKIAWFVGAIIAGHIGIVKQIIDRSPHYAIRRIDTESNAWSLKWADLDKLGLMSPVDPAEIAAAIGSEDMLLLLLPHYPSHAYPYADYENMPRVVANCFDTSAAASYIIDALKERRYDFIEKVYEEAPLVVRDVKRKITNRRLSEFCETADLDQFAWLIDHECASEGAVERHLKRVGRIELIPELHARYPEYFDDEPATD